MQQNARRVSKGRDPIYAKTTDVNHKKVGKRRNKHRISTFFSLKLKKQRKSYDLSSCLYAIFIFVLACLCTSTYTILVSFGALKAYFGASPTGVFAFLEVV